MERESIQQYRAGSRDAGLHDLNEEDAIAEEHSSRRKQHRIHRLERRRRHTVDAEHARAHETVGQREVRTFEWRTRDQQVANASCGGGAKQHHREPAAPTCPS